MDYEFYDNVNEDYDYSWNESHLFKFLSRNYMFNELEITLNDGTQIDLEKYNVCGSIPYCKILNIYETNGNTTDKPLHSLLFTEIKTIKTKDSKKK